MNKVGYYLFKGMLRCIAAMPLRVHYFNSSLLCPIVRHFYRRKVVEDNLRRAFPQMSDKEREVVLRKFYRHFTDLIVETIWFGGCSGKRLRRQKIVDVIDPKPLNEVYEKSDSVFVLYSHAGNWELLGGLVSYCPGREFCATEQNYSAVYKKMSSELWDRIMNENRIAPLQDKSYDGLVESQSIIRYVLSHRGQKKIYTVNTDQRPYRSAKGFVTVQFMNQETRSMAAAATLAAKFHLPVVYQRMMNDRRGHYTIEYVPICDDASQMPVEEIMQRYYDLLSADLRTQPENYLWTHRRWA